MAGENNHKSLKWGGLWGIAHSTLRAVTTLGLGREWGVVGEEEAQNLAHKKPREERPVKL